MPTSMGWKYDSFFSDTKDGRRKEEDKCVSTIPSSKRVGRKNVRVSKKEKTGGTRIRKRERDMGSLPSLLSLSLSLPDGPKKPSRDRMDRRSMRSMEDCVGSSLPFRAIPPRDGVDSLDERSYERMPSSTSTRGEPLVSKEERNPKPPFPGSELEGLASLSIRLGTR